MPIIIYVALGLFTVGTMEDAKTDFEYGVLAASFFFWPVVLPIRLGSMLRYWVRK